MEILHEQAERGVAEIRFDLKVGTELVPGILWRPDGVSGPRPTVLIGHGGSQDKRAPNVLGLARRFVRHLGYAAVALDAPGHGERVSPEETARMQAMITARIAAGRDAGQPQPMPEEQRRVWADRVSGGVAEWKALLDDLTGDADLGRGPFGYWGLSMGTMIGLPFVAAEPRITAAVLGLAGAGGVGAGLTEAAAKVTIPVLFVFQSDDELMTRASGLDLFDAFASKDKAMHLFPGGHVETPLHERDAYEAFYVRTLGRP